MSKSWLSLLLLVAALVAWLFAPALSGQSSFSFRDAAHFYHPLFEYVRGEWGAGRVPLWNPYENLGVPLLAENTSSVFYPGKLLFALPLDYTWLYNLYIVAHVVLAAVTSYRFARHLRASSLGATLGAISYAFSGNVLFQYCNVIFLVGAAWLPLALLYADRMLRLQRPTAILGFAVSVALIVLGGDPHLAYNIGLASAGYALLLWWNDRRQFRELTGREGDVELPKPPSRVPWRLIYLAAGSALAALVAAVQVLPSLAASPHGERSHYDSPRNLYEYVGQRFLEGDSETSLAGLWGASATAHHSHIYAFSVPPWRALEMLWPNVYGRPFPTHRRWLSAFDAEANLWSPSLYFGLLPLLLALRAFRFRAPARVEVRGLSWLAVLAALASLGTYGLGHLAKTILGTGDDLNVGGEVGGLYWLFATVLPGYVQFRYPQKLFVLASLALSMLAAVGWRRAWPSQSSMVAWLAAVPCLSLAAAIGAIFAWPLVYDLRVRRLATGFQGPFDWNGAWQDLFDGLLHAAVLAVALAIVFFLARRQSRLQRVLQFTALAIVAVDLGAAQQYLIEYAPVHLWTFPTKFEKQHPDFAGRVYRQPGLLPPSFERVASQERYAEALVFDRETLCPKFPLPERVRLIEVSQSVAGHDFDQLLEAARLFSRRKRRSSLPDGTVLDLLGANWAVLTESEPADLVDPVEVGEGALLGERRGALPRTWIVHQVEVIPEFSSRSSRETRLFTLNLLFPDNKPRDWRRVAVVETADSVDLSSGPVPAAPVGESCTIDYEDPGRVEIAATLTAPGLVILADQYFPGWELTVETDGASHRAPILRTNRVMRGVVLPAGKHRLTYRYRPRSFYAGAAISVLATLGVTVAGIVFCLRSRRALAQAAKTVTPPTQI